MAEPKREVVLLPGQFVWVRLEKGNLKVYCGPYKWDLGTNDALVLWNKREHKFEEVPLERAATAIQQQTVVPENWYAVLTNPAKKETEAHPETGKGNDTVDLNVGQKINLHGPAMFPLWPGQEVERIQGHHLSRDQYVRIKIVDAAKAKANWSKAAVSAETTEGTKTPSFFASPPSDLAVGKQYNVRGDAVSFYMPPTGVSVVREAGTSEFVRQALTLQLLQYCVREDEDGNKRYTRGPEVVFLEPTETFRTAKSEDNAETAIFRAQELNAIQRIHLKFSKDVAMDLLGEGGQKVSRAFKAGDEVSFTGAELPIYYPEEGHQIVTYDGKMVHYAVQISEGEARYVLERMTGLVKLTKGPAMLLPDPTREIIALRPLTDQQVRDWYPGPDGNGSAEALEWNRRLREKANREPTTRSGVVSAARAVGMDAVEAAYAAATGSSATYAANAAVAAPARRKAAAFTADVSRQGKEQALPGDTTERSGSFTDPRSVTLFNKFKGVPLIDLWPGFAVSLNRADGTRETIEGPRKILLDFGDTLDTLQVSTGKPKTTDRLQRVTYLQVKQNRITDVVEVMTSDNVRIEVKQSYVVDFTGDRNKWFTISNFVKHLCDSMRSRLKAAVRRKTVRDFYGAPADFIRDLVLGETKEGAGRSGMLFVDNGMKIVDVDVLSVEIQDQDIHDLLDETQREVITNAIAAERASATLMLTRHKEDIERKLTDEKAATFHHAVEIAIKKAEATLRELGEQRKIQQAKDETAKFVVEAQLAREQLAQEHSLAKAKADQILKLEMLGAETAAIVARFEKVSPGFTEALLALKDASVVEKVAQALSVQTFLGDQNVAEVFKRAFSGTTLEGAFSRILASAGRMIGGPNGSAATGARPQ